LRVLRLQGHRVYTHDVYDTGCFSFTFSGLRDSQAWLSLLIFGWVLRSQLFFFTFPYDLYVFCSASINLIVPINSLYIIWFFLSILLQSSCLRQSLLYRIQANPSTLEEPPGLLDLESLFEARSPNVHPRHSFRQSHFLLDGPSFLVFGLGDDVVRVRRHQVIFVLVVLLDLLSGTVRAGPYDDRRALPQGENASSSSLAATGSVAVAGRTITTVPQGARYGLVRIV
jgi:hypothetical protein